MASVSSAAITHVVPQITYQGDYPTVPLEDGTHGGFAVTAVVHLWAAAATSGTLTIGGSWGETSTQAVSIPAGDSKFSLRVTASASQIKLWWPAGLGQQPLYNLTATFVPSTSDLPGAQAGSISTTRRVGFRFFALVTGDDLDPTFVKNNLHGDGSAQNGMFWRINGATVLARGANMIPMEELGVLPLQCVRFRCAADPIFWTQRGVCLQSHIGSSCKMLLMGE